MTSDNNIKNITLFSEKGFDEKQKLENHEIGFKLFRIMYFVVLIFSFVLVFVLSYEGSITGTVISLGMFAVIEGFYMIYSYMIARKGIMDTKIANNWQAVWIPVLFAIALASRVYCLIADINRGEYILRCVAINASYIVLFLSEIVFWLCAKKNNKVVAKQLKEETEDEC